VGFFRFFILKKLDKSIDTGPFGKVLIFTFNINTSKLSFCLVMLGVLFVYIDK
jgi:hypothetical protein